MSTADGISDGTHKVIVDEQSGKTYQYELRANQNCKMYQLGCTRDEVEKILEE